MLDVVATYLQSLRAQPDRGQGMVEYGLILSIVSIASVAVLALLGPAIVGLLQLVLNTI